MNENTKIEQLLFDADIITVSSENYPANYPFHWHQFVECIAITEPSASAIVSINQKPVTMHSGDILFVWPGELHEVIDNTNKSITALQFPFSLINSKKELAVCHELFRENQFLKYKNNQMLNDDLISNIKEMLYISNSNSDEFKNIKMTIVLYEMFIKIAHEIKAGRQSTIALTDSSNNIRDKINMACSYITNHCSEDLTLDDVASYVGFSSCYFSRHFKKITTHSFVEYLILQRINKFQVLLTDKSISITDAAFQAGFKSISTVNRVFSKYCGCSPRDFRNYYAG